MWNQYYKLIVIDNRKPIKGTDSEVAGTSSAINNMNIENAKNTLRPKINNRLDHIIYLFVCICVFCVFLYNHYLLWNNTLAKVS